MLFTRYPNKYIQRYICIHRVSSKRKKKKVEFNPTHQLNPPCAWSLLLARNKWQIIMDSICLPHPPLSVLLFFIGLSHCFYVKFCYQHISHTYSTAHLGGKLVWHWGIVCCRHVAKLKSWSPYMLFRVSRDSPEVRWRGGRIRSKSSMAREKKKICICVKLEKGGGGGGFKKKKRNLSGHAHL